MPEQEQTPKIQIPYEVKREGAEDILYVNYSSISYSPSIADSPDVMEKVIELLMENPNVSRVVLKQQKNYNYNFEETSYLIEIASLYTSLLRQEKILSREKLIMGADNFFPKRYNDLFGFLYLLKRDPAFAFFELKKFIIEARILSDKFVGLEKKDQENYTAFLEKIYSLLISTSLMKKLAYYLEDYKKGDRGIYSKIFSPNIIPNFTLTRLVWSFPENAEIVDQYDISLENYDVSNVSILRKKDESKLFYHLNPPENSLTEEHNILLNLARGVLIEHQPKAEEFTDTERTRQVFFNIAKDLISDLSAAKKIKINFSDLNKLATILVRHTIGFGLIEVLLQDKKLQDISLNAPIFQLPIYVRHQDYDECLTNILPSFEDADSWAAKFRMISGRPLD